MNPEPLPQSEVSFQVVSLTTPEQECQTLAIDLLKPKSLIGTDELQRLQLPAELDRQREVVLYGRAPNWLLCHLSDQLREVPWLGYYDLRTQVIVVVHSRVDFPQVGDVIPVIFKTVPGCSILIGGPPNSGKSVFSNALRVGLMQKRSRMKSYLHRANWDGEGNHTYETPNPALAEQIRKQNNRKLHKHLSDELLEKYLKDRAGEIERIRTVTDLVLIDVGGVPDSKKAPIVEQCTYSIIISNDPDKVQSWRELFQPRLKPLAVIHSVLEERVEVLQTDPYLEMIAGPWLRDRVYTVPDILLDKVLQAIDSRLHLG
ncbi:CRISPR-associated protein Csx3 [Cyanobacteria bacterium FACHB-DQ100]|nr:CRISPR-associated protein Csx3 [Cyanobacteria bacterium FACHB-DQ100]